MRLTDVANTEQLLRIIQSIPSKKAEPFKMWLAQVGRERIEEVIDPELPNTEISVIEVTEELLREKLYEIRGVKVMLDVDLAEIYGYTTKALNQQVQNNKDRFESDFTFKLTRDEWQDLRSKNLTSSWGGSRYAPNVFTEQGVYMLMTILKGELAAKQSRDLVRTFKKMKDYILGNQTLIGQREVMRLSMQTIENTTSIRKLRADIGSVERQMSDVMEQLGDVVTKSELADMMNSFVSDEDNGWLLYNTKYCSADVAYSSIYGQAKKSVYVIDNYIGLRTLVMLKNVPSRVDIKLFSDNVGSGKLHNKSNFILGELDVSGELSLGNDDVRSWVSNLVEYALLRDELREDVLKGRIKS